MEIVISWKIFPNTCSHWLLLGHMTSNNETAFRQNLWVGMMSEGNSALQPMNVDQQPLLQ